MAIYTKPRSEKKVAERLSQAGLEIYCPLETTIRQWSDRKKKVSVPIFPSYVFLRILESDRKYVLMDPGVLNFVFWQGRPAIIRDEEIEAIKTFHSSDEIDSMRIEAYHIGDVVDITSGSFRGMKGLVHEIGKKTVTFLVESLGVSIKLKINKKYI